MLKRFISFLIFTVFVWLIWSYSGRNMPLPEPQTFLSVSEEVNLSDSLKRNVVGIQPYMLVTDFFDPILYKEKLRQYLSAANSSGFIRKNTTVVFPQYIGTWLVLADEKHVIAEEKTLNNAFKTLIFSNVFDYFLGYIKTGNEKNVPASAILRMKSKQMASVYYSTFSELAKEFQTYIVAGSIILPGPYVSDGELFLGTGKDLYNASFIFGPDGKIIGNPILEIFPNSDDLTFLKEPENQSILGFQLPFANASVLLGEDSWYPELYTQNAPSKSEVILVPSFQLGNNSMDSSVVSTNRKPFADTDKTLSMNGLKLKDVWKNYFLSDLDSTTTLKVNVFLKGEFWEFKGEGHPMIIYKDSILSTKTTDMAGIWSVNY
ncbi:hypothetical protein JYB64_12720 [Algoriphagus aestuarii]|nr:hypothetical protein [Algoriphagus aestuarii]